MLALLLARQIAILYMIAAAAVVLVRTGKLHAEDGRALSSVMLYIVLPCIILNAFQVENTPWVRRGFYLSILIAVLMHGIIFVLAEVFGRIMKMDEIEKTSLIYTNCGNLVMPVVSAVFGPEWVVFVSGFMTVQMCFYWSHGLSLLSGERKIDIRKIVANPNVIMGVVGALMLVTGIRLPAMLREPVGMVASMAGPLAMINMGMIFAALDWKEIFSRKRTYEFLLIKMLLLPCILVLIVKLLGLSRLVENGEMIVVIAMLPFASATATMVAQLAQVLGKDARYAGAINAATTVCAIVTIPLVVWLYQL